MGTTTKEIGGSSFNDMISSVDRRSEYVENRAGANVRLNNFLTPYTLDDKSSILNAPCGYSNGVYPSLRPVATYGAELITNGDFSNGLTGWSSVNTTIVNNRAYVDASADNVGYIKWDTSLVAGKFYKITFDLEVVQGSVYFENWSGSINKEYTGAQTITETLIFKMDGSQNKFLFGRNGLYSPRAIFYVTNISVKEQFSADFTFTRGSAATRVTKDGLIKNVQILSDDLVKNGNFEQIGSEEVTNGDFSQIGSELITNGDFATDSNWSKGTGWSIANGKANCDGSFSSLIQFGVYSNPYNKSFVATINVSNYTSGHFSIGIGGYDFFGRVEANGEHKIYFNVTNSQSNDRFYINGQGFNGSIDNVSVKEVGQDWDLTDGATITDNGVRILSDGTLQKITQNNILTVGKQYKIQYEILENNSGELKMSSSFGLTPIPSTVGTHTVYAEALQTFLSILRVSACDITITNISIKEVGQNWTFGTGWNMGDGKAVSDGSQTGTSFLYQLYSFTSGKKYRITYDIEVTSGSIFSRLAGGGSTVDGNTQTASGTYTDDLVASTNHTNISFGASSDFVGSIDNVSVIEVTDDTDLPRIDYTNGTGSLLLEPQSTNLIAYSEDYTDVNTWIKSFVTLDSNNIISPDGTQNASKLTISGTTPYLGNTKILTAGNTYTVSCFVKKGTNRWVRLTNITSGTTGVWFDLENKVVGSSSASSLSSSIKSYGNDWYKIENTFIAQSGSANTFLGLSDSNNQTSSSQVGNTVYVWGFQIEELSYATSYIPTSGSSVTRNQDLCINAGSSDLINSTEGVLYAEIAALANQSSAGRSICISDGTNSHRALISYSTVTNQIQAFHNNGITSPVNLLYTVSDITVFHKIAFKYKLNDFSLWVDGVQVATNFSGGVNTVNTFNALEFQNASGTSDFYGRSRSVAVFTEALTNEELAKITSTTQQEAFYEMRDKMLQINADYYEFGDYTTRLKKLF